jgi:SAM-dependent methyltransferase
MSGITGAPGRIARTLKGLLRSCRAAAREVTAGEEVASYWTEHNVTAHRRFTSATESLEYFQWRNDQYFGYIELMPVAGQDGKVVVDFGCGPGHDLVGFGCYSKPSRLVGIDVSPSSLTEAHDRLDLHGIACELIRLEPSAAALPLADESVDYVHSSGVLHHTPDPLALLRVLRRDGTARIMVYNYNSLWVHLYVAYQKQLVEGMLQELDLRAAFSKTTDGTDCPISRVYRPDEFIALCREARLDAEWSGAAISMHEAGLFARRYEAIMDPRLNAESRRFLLQLELDHFGFPRYHGHYAGVDGCYRLRVAA